MRKLLTNTEKLKPGTFEIFEIDDKRILLTRTDNGKFYATDSKCTHYGAPLETGILSGERIVCPWHHACFSCKSGEVLDPPALADLKNYDLHIEDDKVYVIIEDKKSKPSLKKTSSEELYIILGAGAAGDMAARTLLNENFNGKILIITDDKYPPYDRPELSKGFLQGDTKDEYLPLQPNDIYSTDQIELLLETSIVSLDTITKTVTLDNGKNLVYSKLLVATGSKPRIPFIPGSEMRNIFTLRNYDDATGIIEKAKQVKECVIIGSSFIAMETASCLKKYDVNITIITKDNLPFEKIFGSEIGQLLLEAHESEGVKFITNSTVKNFIGSGSVEGVTLDNGEVVKTEMLILGVGADPSTDFIRGVNALNDGSLEVNKFLSVTKDVYAAGDVVTYYDARSESNLRVEHWRTAQQQGKVASLNMMDKQVEYNDVPFFWTDQAGVSLQYVGHAKEWDEIKIVGDVSDKDFLAYYLKGDKVLAVAGVSKDKEIAAIEELFRINKMPAKNDIPNNSEELFEILNSHVEETVIV